jgi:hypothetical protein
MGLAKKIFPIAQLRKVSEGEFDISLLNPVGQPCTFKAYKSRMRASQ